MSDSLLSYLHDISGSSRAFWSFSSTTKIILVSVIMTHFEAAEGSLKFKALISHLIQNFSPPPTNSGPT